MLGKTSMRMAATGLAALLGWVAPLVAQQQQTGDAVADAARKTREQKKAGAKPKKVYTEDDFARSSAAASAAQPAADTGKASEAAEKNAAEPNIDKAKEKAQKEEELSGAAGLAKQEAYWRGKFREQREKIASVQKELDILSREVQKSQVQYYADPQKAMSEQNTRKDLGEKAAKLAAKNKELQELNSQFSDLEDQLRKSGGDLGWARE